MLANFRKLQKPKEIYKNENIKYRLKNTLEETVKRLVSKHKETPIAFSGGLDSSILAFLSSKYTKPVLFCVGFKDSYDINNSQKCSKLLMLETHIVCLNSVDLEQYLYKTIELIDTDNKLVLDLTLPIFVLAEKVKKMGYRNLMLGQGADVLFGGFAKYVRSKHLENDLFNDIKSIHRKNLRYIFKVCNYFDLKPVCPFLEKEIVELALKISPKVKIKDGINKYILREAFANYLPKEIVFQKKKALQYGSGVHKALKKTRYQI